jgi:hypothetical protein
MHSGVEIVIMQNVISVACVKSEWFEYTTKICFSLPTGDCYFNRNLNTLIADLGPVTEIASIFWYYPIS